MPPHLNRGTGIFTQPGSHGEATQRCKTDPGGKDVFSYLFKPGLLLAVFKHPGVEGEPWRGERKTGLVAAKARGRQGGRHGSGGRGSSSYRGAGLHSPEVCPKPRGEI